MCVGGGYMLFDGCATIKGELQEILPKKGSALQKVLLMKICCTKGPVLAKKCPYKRVTVKEQKPPKCIQFSQIY